MAGGNVFEELLKTVQSCSLGQITHALYGVGGRYRRSMEFPEPWLTEASASLESPPSRRAEPGPCPGEPQH